ncbi:MAG: hypothetical protein KBT20_11045 [Bacteroidales bacterium]|nr:hypothetical protein [Candidatus Liminaster caballi]
MIYTLIMNKKSYDLPKKTLAVVEAMDTVVQLDQDDSLSTRQKYQHIMDFEREILGEKAVEEIFGSNDIDQVDLSEVILAFRKIVDAYNKPVQDYERGSSLEAFNQLPLDKLTQLAELVKQASGD